MATQVELLSGGLVTSRDASLLQPGELSSAQDVMLKPGSLSLYKIPGRTKWSTTPLSGAVNGLAYCAFDSATNRLVAVSGSSYYSAPEAGVMASLATGAGASLDVVSLNNRAVLLSGGDNKVLLSDGTSRGLGLAPVTATPGLTLGTGTWSAGASQLGYFDYWTTEVYISGNEEVESTFTGTPATINVPLITNNVTIERPALVNSDATHWRVYRTLKKSAAVDLAVAFPIGFRIASVPITTFSVIDGSGTTDSFVLPTVYTTSGTQPWTNPQYILTDGGGSAVSYNGTGTVASFITLSSFGFTGIGEAISDVYVQINGKKGNAGGYVKVRLSWDAGYSWTSQQVVSLPSGTPASIGVNGLWGRAWASTDFSNTNFRVQVRVDSYTSSNDVSIDFVKVRLTHSGTASAAILTTQFQNVQIVAGPVRSSIGANGQPPSATTGDIFQGSLLMNDVANPSVVAWTLPNTIDYSPAIYRLRFDSKEKDTVKCIRSLGNVVLVGLAGTVERMNYLPVEEDPEFNTGRCTETVDADDGIVGPKAACRFTLAGEQRLFYVGQTGLRMTNGFSVETATDDIIWTDLANSSQLSKCSVTNNSKFYEILVDYPATSGGWKRLRLNYHASHLKNGKLKIAGITNYSAACTATGINNSGERVFFSGGSDGYIYRENGGYRDNSGIGITPQWSTREMHLAGIGHEWELTNLGAHFQAGGSAAITATYTATQANFPARTGTPHTFEPSSRGLALIDGGEAGDGITVNLSGPDDGLPLVIDYLLLTTSGLGPDNTLTGGPA